MQWATTRQPLRQGKIAVATKYFPSAGTLNLRRSLASPAQRARSDAPYHRRPVHAVIARQQMAPWVEKVAHLLLAIYWLIGKELTVGDYLQIDESPVKVLDPEVKGKAARSYLWFCSRPGDMCSWNFIPAADATDRGNGCALLACAGREETYGFQISLPRPTPTFRRP